MFLALDLALDLNPFFLRWEKDLEQDWVRSR